MTPISTVPDPRYPRYGAGHQQWNQTQPEQSKAGTPARLSDAVIAAFQDRLSANRVGMSSILEISFNSSNAERAAEIANAVAKAYIAEQLNAKFEANRSATSWLQDRLRDLGDQALNAERAVSQYKSQNNIVSPDGKSIDEQHVTELNNRLMAARAQLTEASARLNQYEAILRTNPANLSSMGTLDAVGSDVTSNSIINGLRQQYLELTRRENEYSARFGPNHQAVLTLRNRMRELRSSIFEEVRRLAENSRTDLEVAKQRQQQIEKQLAEAVVQSRTTNSAELTIKELENRAKGLRSLSDMFQQRYIGSKQQETFPISETRVIQPAVATAEQEQAEKQDGHGAGLDWRHRLRGHVGLVPGVNGSRLSHLRADRSRAGTAMPRVGARARRATVTRAQSQIASDRWGSGSANRFERFGHPPSRHRQAAIEVRRGDTLDQAGNRPQRDKDLKPGHWH